MVEASRKHGAFDTRWTSGHRARSDGVASAPPFLAADVTAGLDWYAFSARYFRGRRRHSLQALSGYAAYLNGREWRNSAIPRTPRLRLVPNDPLLPTIEAAPEDIGAQRLLAAVEAVEVWEGKVATPPIRTRANEADMADSRSEQAEGPWR